VEAGALKLLDVNGTDAMLLQKCRDARLVKRTASSSKTTLSVPCVARDRYLELGNGDGSAFLFFDGLDGHLVFLLLLLPAHPGCVVMRLPLLGAAG
jgi:hypothetical protein